MLHKNNAIKIQNMRFIFAKPIQLHCFSILKKHHKMYEVSVIVDEDFCYALLNLIYFGVHTVNSFISVGTNFCG